MTFGLAMNATVFSTFKESDPVTLGRPVVVVTVVVKVVEVVDVTVVVVNVVVVPVYVVVVTVDVRVVPVYVVVVPVYVVVVVVVGAHEGQSTSGVSVGATPTPPFA